MILASLPICIHWFNIPYKNIKVNYPLKPSRKCGGFSYAQTQSQKGKIAMASKIRPQSAQQEDVRIQEFLDMITPSVIKFNTDHLFWGNTYRSVWALREYPTATEEQAILRHLGEKGGVILANSMQRL